MTTLFVSDLHLCPTRPVLTGLFCDFLAGPVRQAKTLYILGDLFEYWAGDDDLSDPFNARICADIKATGIKTYVLPGNRDFLFGPAFAAASDTTLLDDHVIHTIEGTPTLLLHGDTLCTDDQSYQDFRKEVRSDAWQSAFLARPLSERKAQIEALRQQSELLKQQKPMAIMDVNAIAVTEAFRHYDVQHMIHGHTHRLATHNHEVDGKRCTRYVLGDWHDNANGGNYLACNGTDWQRKSWPAE